MVVLITGKKNKSFVPRIKKKAKAANCLFLTEDRICTNKKSPRYCEKCFEATYCTYRIKERCNESCKDNGDADKLRQFRNVGLWIMHNFFGKGQIVSVKGVHAIFRFSTGKEVEINLEYCVKNKIIELLCIK